jgi:hypothetical protein
MKRLMTTTALILALPLALSAQQGQGQGQGQMHGQMQQGMHQGQGMGQGMGMHQGMGMQQGMMGMMMSRPGPGMILRLKETLELTEDQVSQLETMHNEAQEAMHTHQQAAQQARMRAHQAMMGDAPDLDAFQTALQEAADHGVQAAMAMARVHTEAAGVLTDAQTEKLHTLMEAMQEMHEGQGMMDSDDMPMREGMGHGGMNHGG